MKGLDRNSLKGWEGKNKEIKILPWMLIGIGAVMTVLSSGLFLSPPNLTAMVYQMPELGLLSLAMMLAMITGGIDLSIVSTANLTGVLIALLLTAGTETVPPIFLVLFLGIATAMVLGALNGLLIAHLNLSPVLTTLGTMILYEGLTLSITKGYVISGFPKSFLFIGNGKAGVIPVPFLLFLLVAFGVSVFLKRRPAGRYLFLVGASLKASEYSGINTKRVLVKAYLLSGLLSGLAGLIMASRFNSANARYGSSYTLLAVLIAVLGGTNPEGGKGCVLGVVLALVSLQALTSGLNLLGVSFFITLAFWGCSCY